MGNQENVKTEEVVMVHISELWKGKQTRPLDIPEYLRNKPNTFKMQLEVEANDYPTIFEKEDQE